MAIAPELRAQILRYYQVEHWRVGTIAKQLGLHHKTVRRVLEQACVMRCALSPRPSGVDAYLPFVLETLTKFPTLAASRLHAMVCERGYVGGADYFRHIVARHRPRPAAEADLRLRTLPGEQAQVDWAHMGHLTIGRAKRPLMAFVMVLSYSRRIFLRFSLNARMDSFLRGHVLAFCAWSGVPRVVLSENLKSAVLERYGDATHLAALGVDPHVAERCLNHKLKGGKASTTATTTSPSARSRSKPGDSCCCSWNEAKLERWCRSQPRDGRREPAPT